MPDEINFQKSEIKEESNKSLLYLVSSFMLDHGCLGVGKIIFNGPAHKDLYETFCSDHPNVKISFDEFEKYVIESLKRMGSAVAAEIAAVPGSVAGAAVANSLLSLYSIGATAFTGSIAANFLAFATSFGYMHRNQFVTENGKFDVKRFIRSLLKEYSVHFGPIAISADLFEGFVIQILADKDLNSVASAAVVTSIGSTMAILFYFYEQQLRLKFDTTEVGKSINSILNDLKVRLSNVYINQ